MIFGCMLLPYTLAFGDKEASKESSYTGSEIKIRTRKNIDNQSHGPYNNHDREDSPPVNDHLSDPSNQNPEEEKKTEFDGKDGCMC